MAFAQPDAVFAFVAQAHGTGQHFVIVSSGKKRCFVFRLGKNAVRVVYADFGACIDAVLSFPKFDQPRSAAVIEVYGEGVEDHLKAGRHVVVEPGVPCVFLPGVHSGREETTAAVIGIAEGFGKFVKQRTFFTFVHAADFADDFFASEMKEDRTEENK